MDSTQIALIVLRPGNNLAPHHSKILIIAYLILLEILNKIKHTTIRSMQFCTATIQCNTATLCYSM